MLLLLLRWWCWLFLSLILFGRSYDIEDSVLLVYYAQLNEKLTASLPGFQLEQVLSHVYGILLFRKELGNRARFRCID
jgi:hypothetical protein